MSDANGGRIKPGTFRGQISARAYNRAVDASNLVMERERGVAAVGPSDATPPYTAVLTKNSTTGAVDRWGVFSVAGVIVTPTGSTGSATQQFQTQPVLSGGLPTGGSAFVVAVEPIGAGKVGRCAVAGVVQAKVNVTDASHKFVTAKNGDSTQFSSAVSGEAEILWKEPGTGSSKWALLRFGAPPPTNRLGKVSGQWSIDTTATVTQWHGDESSAVTGPSGTALTFTAVNRAQTITGPTGGYWVGCQNIDGVWHLNWARCTG